MVTGEKFTVQASGKYITVEEDVLTLTPAGQELLGVWEPLTSWTFLSFFAHSWLVV